MSSFAKANFPLLEIVLCLMLPLLLVDHWGPIGGPLLTMEISDLSTQLLDTTLELQNAWHEDKILPLKLISGGGMSSDSSP